MVITPAYTLRNTHKITYLSLYCIIIISQVPDNFPEERMKKVRLVVLAKAVGVKNTGIVNCGDVAVRSGAGKRP